MSIAESIVNDLLENEGVVRVCASCQGEFGTTPPANASHGYCKRHTLEMYAHTLEMAKQRGNQERIAQVMRSIEEVKSRPESAFCPDQSQQQHAGVAQ